VKRLVLATLVMTTSLYAEAKFKLPVEDCQNVDIREVKPNLKAIFDTPRDQSEIGWCYGFAAADLISAETGVNISAAHVSAIYNKGIASNFFWRIGYSIGDMFTKDDMEGDVYEGGWIGKALKNVRKADSVCLEQNMTYDKNYSGEFKAIILRLDTIQNSVRKNQITDAEAINLLTQTLPKNVFPNLDLAVVLQELKSKNLNKVVEFTMRNSCGSNLWTVPEFDHKNVDNTKVGDSKDADRIKKAQNFFSHLNEALEQGKPVGLSYNVKQIIGRSGSHASVIIARRSNNGRCEYKIRNTWGKNCSAYLPNIECNFSEGSFWVSDSLLNEVAQSITYIK
jgi:hypothetical protein